VRLGYVLFGDGLDGHCHSRSLFVSALENDGEGAMADQVLGVVLEFANALHRHRDVTTT